MTDVPCVSKQILRTVNNEFVVIGSWLQPRQWKEEVACIDEWEWEAGTAHWQLLGEGIPHDHMGHGPPFLPTTLPLQSSSHTHP